MNLTYDCSRVVDVAEEPRHHLVLENEFVRAFAVEIAPQDRTLCHRHPQDYLLYVASDSEIVSAARGEEPKRLSYRDGECELSKAGLVHVVENLGNKPFRNVVVELSARAGELRRGAHPQSNAEDNQVAGFETRVTALLDDERAAIFKLEIELGAYVEISGPAVIATPYGSNLKQEALAEIEVKKNPVCDLAWVPQQCKAVLQGRSWEHSEIAVVFQIGRRSDEAGVPAPTEREPLRSLRAHAEPE